MARVNLDLSPPEKKYYGMADPLEGIIDASAMRDFHWCPRKFELAHIHLLAPMSSSKAMKFGVAMHEALSTWHCRGLDKAREALYLLLPPASSTEDQYNAEFAEALLLSYCLQYGESWEVEYSEIEFCLEMPADFPKVKERKWLYSGRIDLSVLSCGERKVVDYKTSRSVGKGFSSSYYGPDIQMDGYFYAASRLLEDVEGLVVRGISTSKNPSTRFAHVEGERFPALFKECFVSTADRVSRCLEREHFPPDLGSCSIYGGCRFRRICSFGLKESRDFFVQRERERESEE